jgi:dTDP-4-amino-4,6-dideoxygalactose transaminase
MALQIVARAAGLTGEVIVPSFTFIATAHALYWLNITPVFCDVDLASHCIDADRIEQLITPHTSAVLAVHLWGNACNVEALEAVCRRHGLKLFFDASHAFACSHGGVAIGGFGSAEVFSFHATKFVHTFEGGAITTQDDHFAERLRIIRNHGFDGYDHVVSLGVNGKMSEVAAAMGLTSLDSIDVVIAHNRRVYEIYQQHVAGIKGLALLPYCDDECHNCQYIVTAVDEAASGISRDTLMRILSAENILARRYFYPGCHRMEPYLTLFPEASLVLKNTELLAERILCLPTGTSVDPLDVEAVCELLRFAVANGHGITDNLALMPVPRTDEPQR